MDNSRSLNNVSEYDDNTYSKNMNGMSTFNK
jgi:hypothetical protein